MSEGDEDIQKGLLLPTGVFSLDSGLSLTPRLKLNLTVHRADKSVSPLDDWKLKRSLIDYLKKSRSISVPEQDILIIKYRDLKKRKREDPVARGTLVVSELGFLEKRLLAEDGPSRERAFSEWRKGIVSDMDGMELSLEGVKFSLGVVLPKGDDFHAMQTEWEEMAAFGTRGYSRQHPDTIILRRVPSRWFAEPRVSSKPSMLVTHTIFSALGKIRKLDVGEDNDSEEEDSGELVSGLHCKIVVQFESQREFCNALRVLCGRSLNKEGSSLRADYEVSWDRDGYFRNGRRREEQGKRWAPESEAGHYSSKTYERHSQASHFTHDGTHRKRFKD